MPRHSRRTFLKRAAGTAAAGVFISGTKSSGQILGANEAIRVGVAGLHGRGSAHVGGFLPIPGVRITYLIDPDTRTYDARIKQVAQRAGTGKPETVADVRKALEDKNLDAISIATPNHWHSLMAIWACQAGKDVYVEKPCSHNVHEGRILVETARKHGRIVQHGTQSRAGNLGSSIAAIAQSGKLGKLLISRGLCYKPRGSIGIKENTPAPSQVDFNLWLGPAAERPHNGNLVHYNWHWFWDFGNGDIGNQGVHQMDVARWAIPGATLPKSVISVGGRFGYKDQGETANTQVTVMDYGETQLVFEVRGLKTDGYHGEKVGNTFHFEAGVVTGGKFYPKGSDKAEALPKVEITEGKGRPGGGIFGNFIAAMKSRKHTDLVADVLEGHLSSALCHYANISYRLGSEAAFGGKTDAFLGNSRELDEGFGRLESHLRDNGVDLNGLKYRMGKRLVIDPKTEGFGDTEADKLLTRAYRKGFEVPEKVG